MVKRAVFEFDKHFQRHNFLLKTMAHYAPLNPLTARAETTLPSPSQNLWLAPNLDNHTDEGVLGSLPTPFRLKKFFCDPGAFTK
jgi:hypothetical protein